MKLATWQVGTGSRSAALIHGASMDHDIWKELAQILVDEYDFTITTVDLRGHGDSPRSDDYHPDRFADDLVDTLPKGLHLLMGQSLGGRAAAQASGRLMPDRYIGLDPALTASAGAAWLLKTLGPLQPKMADWMLKPLGFPPPGAPADVIPRTRARWAKWDTSMMKTLVKYGKTIPIPIAPPPVPSTMLLAENSFVVNEKLAAEFRAQGWDIRVKPGGVHDLHVQDPRGVVDMLDDVLRP